MTSPSSPPMLWRAIYEELSERLGSKIDARRIVERASGRGSGGFVVAPEEPVPARAVPFVEEMATRRLAGEPLQYVVGRWGFRSLDLLVDRRVLIPPPGAGGGGGGAPRGGGRRDPPPPRVGPGAGAGAPAPSVAGRGPPPPAGGAGPPPP